mgnify:CR=1 FL=1
MKLSNSVKWLLALTLAGWPGGRARAQSIMPPVAAATQAEVNAGTVPRKYVAPLTLAGWTAASATNLARLNSNNIFTGASNRFTGAVNFAAALWATNLSGPSGGSLSLGTGGTPFMLVNDIGIGTYNGTAFYGNGSGLTNLPVSAITNASEYFDPQVWNAVTTQTNLFLLRSNILVIPGIWQGATEPGGSGGAYLLFNTNAWLTGFYSDGLFLDVYAGLSNVLNSPSFRFGDSSGTINASKMPLTVAGYLTASGQLTAYTNIFLFPGGGDPYSLTISNSTAARTQISQSDVLLLSLTPSLVTIHTNLTVDGGDIIGSTITAKVSANLTNATVRGLTAYGNAYQSNSATVGPSDFTVTNTSAANQGAVFGANYFNLAYGSASTLSGTNGNVGIGTTAPSYKLDVYTTGTSGLRVTDDDIMPTFALSSGNVAATTFSILRAANVFSGAAENDVAFVAPTSRSLRFGEGTTEYVTFKTGGNVGIGTVSPTAALHTTNAAQQAIVFKVDTTAGAVSFQVASNGVTTANLSGSSNAVDLIASTGIAITTNTAGRTFTLASALTNNTGLPGVVVGSGIGTNLSTLPTLSGDNIFIGTSNRITGDLAVVGTLYAGAGNYTSLTAATFSVTAPNGAMWTNLTGANVTGTVPDATRAVYVTTSPLSNSISGNATTATLASYVSGILTNTVALASNVQAGATLNVANGSALTNLNASNLASGTVPSARLTGASITNGVFGSFTNLASPAGAAVWAISDDGTAIFDSVTAAHAGNGASLTSLNAANLASGTMDPARMATNAATANARLVATSASTAQWQDDSTTVAFASATNSLALGWPATYSTFTMTTAMEVTNVTGAASGKMRSGVLTITNSTAGNLTLYLPTAWRTSDGARSFVITNAQETVLSVKVGASTNAVCLPLW